LSGTDYQAILLRRAAFRGRVDRVLASVDVLLTPVQPFAPLSLAQIRTLGAQPDLIARLQRYTCPFNMSGHPTLTLPGGFSDDGMPVGFQLVAPRWREDALVQAGAAFQARTSWHRRHPER
jgi:amidase